MSDLIEFGLSKQVKLHVGFEGDWACLESHKDSNKREIACQV